MPSTAHTFFTCEFHLLSSQDDRKYAKSFLPKDLFIKPVSHCDIQYYKQELINVVNRKHNHLHGAKSVYTDSPNHTAANVHQTKFETMKNGTHSKNSDHVTFSVNLNV